MRAPLAGAHNALREIHQSPEQYINRNKYQRHNPSHRLTHPLCLCFAHGANRGASERRAQEGRIWSFGRKSRARSYRKTAPTTRRTGKLTTNARTILGLIRPTHSSRTPARGSENVITNRGQNLINIAVLSGRGPRDTAVAMGPPVTSNRSPKPHRNSRDGSPGPAL